MSDAVLIEAPDGTFAREVVFSTSSPQRFFRGALPAGAVDVEVSVDDGPWTADPVLVSWSGVSFTVPNPAASPEGYPLHSGVNSVAVRAVLLGSSVTPAARATVQVVAAADWDAYPPPAPLTVERLEDGVRLTVEHAQSSTAPTGYHFYGSLEPGGGEGGYVRLTPAPVSLFETFEQKTELFTLESRAEVTGDDPNYYRVRLSREDEEGVVRGVDADDRVGLPEGVGEVSAALTLSRVDRSSRCSFLHRRGADPVSDPPTVFVGAFASRPPGEPLYYVATAVYWDATAGAEFESYYSVEVAASPVQVRAALVSLPAVSRSQVLEDAVFSIHRTEPQAAVQPGAVVRDTFLDPLASEVERLRFILDFAYRASSFDLLLAIDDPEGTGGSVAPAASAYKTALAAAFFLADPADVQPVIDAAFEKLAANVGVPRGAGERARAEARFYTSVRPTRTLPLPLGTTVTAGSVQFRTLRAAELPVDSLASHYDPITRVYSVSVPVEASDVGAAGNVGPRQITGSAAYGFSVTNDAPAYGGLDRDSNARLAAKARGALAAVDSGTVEGLRALALRAGATAVEMVPGDHPLMVRDYDPVSGTHRGGAVDVWARGRRLATVRETFFFRYERRYSVQFVPVGAPSLYRFRAVSSELTPDQPLAAMLDSVEHNLGLRSISSGAWFDLTGVTILNYNTIQLNLDVTQPPVTVTEVITGDFRLRRGVRYVPARQPVVATYSLVGEVTGEVDPTVYRLERASSVLSRGRSTRAGDYLQLVEPAEGSGLTAPSGNEIQVTDELHVFTGFYPERLDRLGADPLSVVVRSVDGSVTYFGPDHPGGSPDYTVEDGTLTAAAAVRRVRGGRIADGDAVVVSYLHAENFTLTYQTNLVTENLQAALDAGTHLGSDVLAREMVEVPVVLSASLVLSRGAVQSTVDRAVRSRLAQMVARAVPGMPLRRSDVIATLDRTPGVEYVAVPLTRMARAAGSQVTWEPLPVTVPADAVRVPEWSTATVSTWLLSTPLSAPTLNGGGGGRAAGARCSVYEGGRELSLVTSNPASLGATPGSAFIVGADGYTIPSLGAITGKVAVSLPVGETPLGRSYWVSYVVTDSDLEYDITVAPVEYIVLGDFTATYTEARS